MGHHIDIPHTQCSGTKGQCQSVRTGAPLVKSTHMILFHIQVGQNPHPLIWISVTCTEQTWFFLALTDGKFSPHWGHSSLERVCETLHRIVGGYSQIVLGVCYNLHKAGCSTSQKTPIGDNQVNNVHASVDDGAKAVSSTKGWLIGFHLLCRWDAMAGQKGGWGHMGLSWVEVYF